MPTNGRSNIVFCRSLVFFRLWLKQYYREVSKHHKAALFTLVSKAMGAMNLIGTKDSWYCGLLLGMAIALIAF